MKHLKSQEQQRDENDLREMKKFIQKFDIEDDASFEKETKEYMSQFGSGVTKDQFISFLKRIKDNLYESESDIITREYIDEYVSIVDRMISILG